MKQIHLRIPTNPGYGEGNGLVVPISSGKLIDIDGNEVEIIITLEWNDNNINLMEEIVNEVI